ncbi:SKP1-like protein 21 isoform X1 [Daucus carota subsp. sativus]|uniref:SKP1-like protein 21 isoform X1 n=1 Tax=Daucus carota subsp. sativus TaxID=79200 RepID=UPI0007EFC4A6|nr:PREDICTED: SKP1-like protein 21 isoform X1 [Daucus carota subsp. sativus]XP_017243362.1 PREDICTED: SKP1-like protein 21 isoform X1 [Daucus carota subsp. sativus]XP_017243363.1 PREDICTED: SKP1-like protein 21 isoform X1 [Daucus carota subsp. sativus]XP_017243364.1 PREDICTED: SKP1-like protein 21 isoform X1 [Daucus carota subsp. sativus]XP_017243365.1 PREDICTED: SKP1-like protein 21 isoform X1 [Daucus carota subsp. sativus]
MSDNLVANIMSKVESEVKKPENMTSYVWIQTADGSIQEVEQEVAIVSPTIEYAMKSGLGSSKNNPISLVPKVRATSLSLVFDYCRFQVHRSEEEQKTFDENFLQIDARSLCELIILGNDLQLRPLIDCTCEALAQRISNNSTEEIWHMLNLHDDLPELENLDSRGKSVIDSRIRLLEKLYKKKKQTILNGIESLKNFMAGLEARQHEDTRKVEDLVSFINGGDGDPQTFKKKKNRKKRAQKKTSSSISSSSESPALKKFIENHDQDLKSFASTKVIGSTADTSKLLGTRDESFIVKKDVDDSDWDPALKEALHREVVEFARRLNLNYGDLI